MSAKVFSLIKEYYDEALGAPIQLLFVLADEADDQGCGIEQPVGKLARDSRQTTRAVQKQMRRLEQSGFLLCRNHSAGGAGKFSEYSLNLPMLLAAKNPERGTGLTLNMGQGSDANNPEHGTGFSDPHLSIGTCTEVLSTKDKDVTQVVGDGVPEQAEFRRMAEWMFGLLVKLNPKVRAPSWSQWCRDIRYLVVRDRHTLREVAELFKFANGHPFWCSNIESPGKLRKQWNRLLLERDKAGGGQAAVTVTAVDASCSGTLPSGDRCGAKNATSDSADGKPPYFCWSCRQAMERARASVRRPAHAHG